MRNTPRNIAALIEEIFGDTADPLAEQCSAWLASSRSFAVFLDAYRTKVRKKFRDNTDAEARAGVYAELATAEWLLRDRRCTLAYEPLSAMSARGPDFAVSFRTRLQLYVEVRRLRIGGDLVGRIMLAAAEKLGQMPPGLGTALVLVHDPPLQRDALSAAMQRLDAGIAADDQAVLQRSGLATRELRRHFQRLSAMRARPLTGEPEHPIALWLNSQARHPLSSELTALLSS